MFHGRYDNVIGIDVASRNLDVHDLQAGTHAAIDHNVAAIQNLITKQQEKNQPLLAVMEATGGSEQTLVDALQDCEIDCSVVNPRRIRKFANDCGKLEKSDKIDARILAEYGGYVAPTLKAKHSEKCRKLRALVNRRSQILPLISAEQNRLKQSFDDDIKEAIQECIDFYQRQINKIDLAISDLVKTCQELSHQNDILKSCPGVGPATIEILLTALPELGQISRGQIAKLVGVAPVAKDSGTIEGRRKTCAGRSMVRRVLFMAALVSTRHNPRFKAMYQSLLDRGKPKKVAIVTHDSTKCGTSSYIFELS